MGSSGVYSRKQYSEWASLKINLSGYSRIFGVLKGYYKADVKIPVLIIYDASNNIVSYFEATSGNGDVNVSVDTAITANMSYAIVTSKLTSNEFLTLAATKGSTPINKIAGAVESNGITQADEYYLNLTGAVLDPNVYTGTTGTYNKGSKFAQWYCTEIDLTNARSIEGKAVAYSNAGTNLPILIIFDANGTVVHYIDATGSNDSVQEFNITVTSNMAKAIVQFRNSYSGIFIKTRYSTNKLPTLDKAYYSLPLFYPKSVYNVANDIDYKVSGQTHTGPRSELKRNFSAVLHLDNFIRSVTSEPKGLTFENGAIQKIIPAYSPVITSGAIENPNLNNGANIYNETVSYKVLRNANEIQRTLLNRSVLNSASKDKTPTILIIGDSVSFGQDAYFAGGKDKWNYTMILNRMFANDKMQNGGTGYGFRTVGTISYTDKDGNKSFNEAYSGTTLQGAGLFTNPKFLDGSNNFSFQNWLDKYRTCDDNGNRLYFDAAGTTTGTAGTNNIGYLANGTDSGFLIGSQISDTMSIDVYKPTHVFCFHCSNAAITKADYDLLISRVRSTFPNAIIGLGAPRVAGTNFPSHYPNIFRSAVWEYDQTYNNRHIDTIDVLLNSMSTQVYENDKVFVLPTSFVNPAAEAFSTIKINNPYSDIVSADESLLMPVGQRVDVHVGAKAQAAYAYQLYAWLKWTAVSNLF
ncbi:hypothetical protein RBI12_04920 [Acinetobacter pittii]|uniref:hypothetical protein n=1 Tax=Acinetobacter pittii TaxID=48296 RepID=UPI00366F0D13